MSSPRILDLYGVAVALGRSKDWVGRHWRAMALEQGFPRPFVGAEPHGSPRWREVDIESWKGRRAGGEAGLSTPLNPAQPQAALATANAPANDLKPRPATPSERVAAILAAS